MKMDSGCISHFPATCWSSSYDLLVQVSGFLILFFKDHSLNSVNSNLFSAGGSFFFHWLPCVRFPLQLSPRIQYSSTYLVYKMPERGLFLLFFLFFTAFCNIPHLSVIFNITLLNWSLCHSGTKSSFSLRDEFQIPRNGIIFIGSSHLSSFQISFF